MLLENYHTTMLFGFFDLILPSFSCFSEKSEFIIYIKSLGPFWFCLVTLILPWATVWYFLALYDVLPDVDNFNPALSEFGIIFSLYFYKIINDSWHSYSESIRAYYSILDQSLSIGINTYSSISYMKDYKSVFIDSSTTDFLLSIRDEINLMFYYVTLLFMPFRRETLPKPKLERAEMFRTYEISVGKGECRYSEMCRLCLINIKMWLSEISQGKYINVANMISLNTQLDKLGEQLSAIEASPNIVEISAIRSHVIVVLVIYFMFIIPFKLVTHVRWMIFIIYPFLIFSLIGTIFIVKYIGSPFREINRFSSNPVKNYYDSFIQKNAKYYNEVVSRMMARIDYHGVNNENNASTLQTVPLPHRNNKVPNKKHNHYEPNSKPLDEQAISTMFIADVIQHH